MNDTTQERLDAKQTVCTGCQEWVSIRDASMCQATDDHHRWATEFFLCRRCVNKVAALSVEAAEQWQRRLVNKMRAGVITCHVPTDYDKTVNQIRQQHYGANDE